jgi:hypothetical protein
MIAFNKESAGFVRNKVQGEDRKQRLDLVSCNPDCDLCRQGTKEPMKDYVSEVQMTLFLLHVGACFS